MRSTRAAQLVLVVALCLAQAGWCAPSPANGPPATAATNGNDEATRALTAYQLIVPVQGVARRSLRDTFEERRGGRRHEALDIAAPRGTPVLAAGDGRVVKLFTSELGGLTVYQFDPHDRFVYYYAHLESYANGLREGSALRQGDVIGYVGTTGNAPPNAPHLHFSIVRLDADKRWWKGTPVDPLQFLNAR